MTTTDLRPNAITAAVALLLLSFCTTAVAQNVANPADPSARKRPGMASSSVTRTPITLVPQAQLILDPTFEAGTPWPDWTTQTSTNFKTPICNLDLCGTGSGTAPPFAGDNWAWFGGVPAPETATLGQAVTIPSGVTATLTFQLRIGTVVAPFTDTLTVKIDGTTLQTFTEPAMAETAYTLRTFDVSAFANGASHTILFTYVGPTDGTANFTVDNVNLNTSGGAPVALSAVSRKTHGAAGPFDINLPPTGTPGVECRSGAVAGAHQMIVTFASPVTVAGASVTTGTGSATFSVSGAVVTVDLTGVTNAQTITVTLSNVNDGTNVGNVPVSMGVLSGDTNGNGSVSASDVAQTKAQSGNAAGAGNFRTDVNSSGGISAADVALVKSRSGTVLP